MKVNISTKQLKSSFWIFLVYFAIFILSLDISAQTNTSATGTVSGKVWVDANENSTRDSTEVGFTGVQIELYNGLTLVGKDTSDANGFYSFGNLEDGFYRIRAIRQSLPKEYIFVPWANSKHINEYWDLDENLDSDVDQNQGITENLYLNTSSIQNRNLKFDIGIYIKFGWIGGNVWTDINKNGIPDEINTPEKNVKVKLLDVNSDKTIDSTLTDNLGNYKFDSLITGLYSLIFTVPGEKSMTSNSYLFFNGLTQPILLNNNSFLANYYVIDVGVVPDTLGAIGGVVWEDLNRNGIREIGENPLKGFIVMIRNLSYLYANSTTTNDDGSYSFSNLPDDSYVVIISPNKEFLFSPQDIDLDTLDSDFDPVTYISNSVTIISKEGGQSQNNNTIDAGLYKPSEFGSMGGKLWNDFNKNGIKNEGEPPFVNYPVYLLDRIGNSISTAFTDLNGVYLFTEIASGGYRVLTTTPIGFDLTTENNVTNSPSSDSYFDYADPSEKFGCISIFAYNINNSKPIGDIERDISNINAGFFENLDRSNISGVLWEDQNLNNEIDSLDNRLNGIKVELLSHVSNELISTTFTDSTGFYIFNEIPKGIFLLQSKIPTIYEGVPNDSIIIFASFLNAERTSDSLIDKKFDNAFIRKQGVISGFAWKDITKQGIKIGEKLLPNVEVFLLDSSLRKVDSTFTDSIGNYKFQVYNSGKYLVKFASPNGFKPTKQYVSYSEFNSDVDSTGTTFFYEIDLQKNLYDLSRNFSYIDAGFVGSGQIGFYTWEDNNKNGIQDDTESPISNLNVTLLNMDGSLAIDDVVTDSTGKHTFDNLDPGKYFLDFRGNPSYKPTLQKAGTDSTKDSDLDSLTYLSDPIILTADDLTNKVLSFGAGFQKLNLKGTIGDLVWNDTNKDGIQDNLEQGTVNVIIELYKDGLFYSSDTTDVNGLFNFNNLDSASYKIKVKYVSIPANFNISTLKNQGSDNTLDSDIDPITFESDEIIIDLNFPSLINRTDIDIALTPTENADCEKVICAPISIQIRR